MTAHRRRRRLFSLLFVACAAAALACSPAEDAYRGLGLHVDTLSLSDRVATYRATLGASFSIDDPRLSLLADPWFLPRTAGLAGGDSMPADLLAALRRNGLVTGTCRVPLKNTRLPLICRAERAGYVVRFSEPFALGPDSVQVHVVVQQYATPNGPRAERLRFERAYHVARRGETWRAVREARLPQP